MHAWQFGADLLGQVFAHFQARGVHGSAVDDGVGTGQVDEFEHTRVQAGIVGALGAVQFLVCIDEDGFAGTDVAHEAEAHAFQGHGFGSDQVFGTLLRFIDAQAQRTDAVRIAEGQQAHAGDLRNGGVTALDAAVQHGNGLEDGFRVQVQARRRFLDFMRQHVEQHFRIGIGIDVAAVVLEHFQLQLFPVGQVAIVRQGDAEWRIHIERLCFLFARRTGRRVTAMADARRALQRTHVTRTEDVTHEAVGFVHGKHTAVIGRNPCRVLTAMLQEQQCIIEQLIDRLMGNDADDATHGVLLNCATDFKKIQNFTCCA
ncbi:hypothetical protein D3C85_893620 [compost metagenome]